MPCYHPLKATAIGVTDKGKKKFMFLSDSFLAMYHAKHGYSYPEDKIQLLPCGKCEGCRLDYSRQWATRCMLELGYHESSYFVTLTYDDAHVPVSYYTAPETGEAFSAYTLSKRDFQLFMKRLRKSQPDSNIRFYASGEYGSNTLRPHYHAILFGLKLDDLVPYSKTLRGDVLYTSDWLQKVWSKDGCPLGHVIIGEVTWESCAYTARYVLKKAQGSTKLDYETFNIEPEFSLMSRRPGIGRQYYDDHPDMYEFDNIYFSTEKGGQKLKQPRYFEHLIEVDNPSLLEDVKEKRLLKAKGISDGKNFRTDLSPDQHLEVQGRVKHSQIKSLRRDVV